MGCTVRTAGRCWKHGEQLMGFWSGLRLARELEPPRPRLGALSAQLSAAGDYPAHNTPRESERPGLGTACTLPRTMATSPAATPRSASTWHSKTLKALDSQLDRPSFDGKRWHPARRQATKKRTKSGWVVDPSAGGPTSLPHSPRAQRVADFLRSPPSPPPTPPASERLQSLNAHQER